MYAVFKIINTKEDTFDVSNVILLKKYNTIKDDDFIKKYDPKIWNVNRYFLLQCGWSFISNIHVDESPYILLIDINSDKIDKHIYQILRDLKLNDILN